MNVYEWHAGLEQLAHHDQYGRLAYDANEEIIRLKERLADLNSYATGIQSQRDRLKEALAVILVTAENNNEMSANQRFDLIHRVARAALAAPGNTT